MDQKTFLVCLLLISNQTTMTTSVTHWIQNNAGLIVPLLTSPYYMKNSNDLVAFLNQSIHKKKLDDLMSQLMLINKNLTWKMSKLDEQSNDLPDRISCIPEYFIMDSSDLSGQLPKEYLERINFVIEIDDNIPKTTSLPRCSDFLKLDFSSEPFEYLDGIKRRHKLDMGRDESIDISELGIPNFMFQHFTYTLLEENPNSWKSHLLGSYYWRLKGNAREAIECARRAIHLCPQRLKDVSLLSLGTILQRSNYLNDSLIVIESAVNHAPHVTENLWNLCNNYLLLSQFEKSFECFQKVESQDAAYSARIDYIKNSFRCFRDLKVTLLAMENTVNEIPSELILYRELKKELEEIHEKLEKEQVPLKVRDFDERFDEQKHNLVQRSQICTKRHIENEPEPVLFCDFLSDVQVIMQDLALDLLDNYVGLKTELIDTYKIDSLGIFKNIFVENYSNEID